VAGKDEHLMEAPYLVTDTNRRGWGVACSCGWRSPLFEEREDALTAAKDHLEIDAQMPAEEPKGFLAKRRAKKQQRSEWDERRRS
jgi:hypothetical protein